MKLNVITLFSGYDSQCLALDRLKHHNPQFDYDLVAWSEIDPNAIKAHNALFPQWQDRNLGDVSKVDWQAKAAAFGCKIDLLTYSSPCQDFSSAGLQKGGQQGSGTRSSLLWECERAIETLHPKYLLFENVSALFSEKFRPTFFKWCLTLEKLGYTNHYQLMNAKEYGVPQNRLRVFMVSVLDCSQAYYFPKPFPLTRRLKDVLEQNVAERYYLSDERVAKLMQETAIHSDRGNGFAFRPHTPEEIASTVKCSGIGDKTDNFVAEPQDNVMLGWTRSNTGKGDPTYHPVNVANCVTAAKDNLLIEPTDPTIISPGHGYFEGAINTETSPTVKCSAMQAQHFVSNGIRIRRLTERELYRLMDVDEPDIDTLLNAGISNTQLAKLAGNSIVTACMYYIFHALFIETTPPPNTQTQLF